MRIDDGPFSNGLPPTHPGEHLGDDLEAMEMSAEEFDKVLALPTGTISAVVEGRCDITAVLALRFIALLRYFSQSVDGHAKHL